MRFGIHAAPTSEVYVAGTFNGWDPKKNRLKYADGVHTANVLLPKGRHEYKFVIDQTWCVDPSCPDWTTNAFGSLNSVITID